MSEMKLKEKAVVATLGVVALYAVAVATWFMSALLWGAEGMP